MVHYIHFPLFYLTVRILNVKVILHIAPSKNKSSVCDMHTILSKLSIYS